MGIEREKKNSLHSGIQAYESRWLVTLFHDASNPHSTQCQAHTVETAQTMLKDSIHMW